MSGLEVLGATSALMTLLEVAISLVRRIHGAYGRQRNLSTVLDRYTTELMKTKGIIQIVRDEAALRTAGVASELLEMDEIVKRLVDVLRTFSQGKGPVNQFLHQLAHGSRNESLLASIMDELNRAKSGLTLRISVAHVGLTSTVENNLVANTAAIERVDALLQSLMGEGQGLKIARLLRDRPRKEDGTVLLTSSDIRSLGDEADLATKNEAVTPPARFVVNNLTEGQALQVNGPVGQQNRYAISRLEIRDNLATGMATQINDAMTIDAFKLLVEHHSATSGKRQLRD